MSMLQILRANGVSALLRKSSTYRLAPAAASLYQKNHMYSTKWTIQSSPYDHFNQNRSFAAEPGFPDRDDVKARVLEVVRKFEKVQPEKVSDDSRFSEDLGLDSLDTVELVMAFEDEFAIEIPDADAEQILTCTDAVEYLSNNIHVK